jgi:hypothetical protein
MRPILNTEAMPKDPIEQIVWLDSVQAQVDRELDALYQQAYFTARTQGRFDAALRVGRASRKAALRWTRRQNESVGRTVRWGDGY